MDRETSVIDERSRIARNALSAYGTRALLGLSALLLTPYLFRRLGEDGFGTWSVIFTLMMISELVEMGFSAGVTKLLAEARGRGRDDQVSAIVRSGAGAMALLGLVIAALAVAAAFALPSLAAPGERDAFTASLLVLAAAVLLRYPAVAYHAALKGHQRYDLSNACDSLLVLGLALGSIAAVEAGLGVFGVALAFAGSLVASGLLALVLLRRLAPGLRLRPRLRDAGERRRVLGFSSFALLAESMVFIGQRMDIVIIAAVRNAAAAAPFAAALKLQSAVQALTLPFVSLLMPMVSELWARGERETVTRRLTLATRVAHQLTLPVAFALALFSADVVDLWLGEGAPPVTAWIVVLLMAVQVMTLTAAPAEKVLIGIGRVRTISALAAVEGVANVSLTIVLVAAYGPLGAALGTLLTSAVLAPAKLPLACRALGCPVARVLREGLAPALLSSAPAVAVMFAAWWLLPAGGLRALVGVGAGIALAVAVGTAQVGVRRALSIARFPSQRPREVAA